MPDSNSAPNDTNDFRQQRLRVLREYDLGGEAPDAALDRLVRLAATLCDAPIGLVTLVDEARQLFRSQVGFDGPPTAPLDVGFCPLVVERGAPLVIPDTLADPEHADNAAAREGGMRFYAGVPLLTEARHTLGTLCVLDRSPRPDGLTQAQLDVLLTLAAQVVSQFELRRSLAQRDALLDEQAATLRQQDALARVQDAIVAANGDLDTILDSLVRNAMDAIPAADGGVLELIEGDALHYRAVAGTLEPHAALAVPLHGSLAGTCADTNTPILVEDARNDPRALRSLVDRLGLRSALLVPVARGAQVLGVLKLQADRPGAFGPRDLQALQLFANVATAGLTEVRATEAQAVIFRARRQRVILDSAIDFAIIATDRDGRVTDWNAGADRILGWTAEEMGGGPVDRIFTPEDREARRPQEEMRLAVRDGRASDERWHLRRDGSRFWASGEMMPLRNENGGLEGYLKIIRDRTEQRQREAAREETARRRTALLQLGESLRNTEDLPAMAAAASEIVGRALDAGWAGFGRIDAVAETLVIDRDWAFDPAYTLAGAHSMRNYGSYIDDLLANRVVAIGDVGLDPRTASHTETLATLGVRALINAPVVEQGRLAAILCVVSDRTRHWSESEIAFVRDVAERTRVAIERRRAELGLRDLNARLEHEVDLRTAERDRMWDSSPDLMVVLSLEGVYQRLNPAWKTVLGYEPAELVGVFATDLTHPDDLEATERALRTAQGGALPVFENRFRHRDGGYRWIQWVAAPGPGGIFATGRHVTEAKQAQARLAEAEQQLRQSQKMEAVGQLTGGLAHDFNNLLTGITGALELMGTRMRQGRYGDLDRYMQAAQGAARRAAALTHRLLAFSRQQTLDPRPTDANRLVLGMEELIRRTVGPAIALQVDTADGLWPTLVDPNQLENAVLNLCINARDAMPRGGRLIIQTSNADHDLSDPLDRDMPSGQYVAIGVTDTGTGMSPEVIAKAFDPFFTTKPLGQGTGLGLSMIYGFARQSGGQVRIRSQEGTGTTMRILLPRHSGAVQDAALLPTHADVPRAREGETVLVVDDEPTIRMLVAEVLEELGYAAIEAADGASGLAVLRSDARIDLLVTDVGLPGGMNGRQMADVARSFRPNLQVLFITGYADTAAVGNGHLDPGMHVITKPFAMDALASRIKQLIST